MVEIDGSDKLPSFNRSFRAEFFEGLKDLKTTTTNYNHQFSITDLTSKEQKSDYEEFIM